MKTKHIIVIVSTLLFTTGTAFCADSQSSDTHPVIGIALDSTPLPALLNKHLGLQPEQGIRIANVLKGSAADKAGIDRDDIVIGFEGKDLYDGDTIVKAVQQAKAGDEVSLQIIHLGQRKTVSLKLTVVSDTTDWKYPNEPQVEQIFRPGRIFRLNPGNQNWTQIFNGQLPGDVKSDINSFFNEIYSYNYNSDGKQYSVTIEGDPNNSASTITVKIDNDQYKTTIGELDKIPEKYREAAKNAIENAKQKQTSNPSFGPNLWQDGFSDNFMPKLRMDSPLLNVPDGSTNPIYKQLEDQMKQMQKQFDEMEKNQQKLLDRFNGQQDKDSI